MRRKRDRSAISKILECKAEGICARDKLVSEWVRGRMITNNALREATVEIFRENADLPVCPPICPEPWDPCEPDPCEPEPCEPDPCCIEGKAEVVDKIL